MFITPLPTYGHLGSQKVGYAAPEQCVVGFSHVETAVWGLEAGYP